MAKKKNKKTKKNGRVKKISMKDMKTVRGGAQDNSYEVIPNNCTSCGRKENKASK